MILKQHQVIINSVRYRITAFNAIEGQKILFNLVKYVSLLTPVLDVLVKDSDKEDNVIDKFLSLGFAKIGIVMSELMDKIGEDKYIELIIKLLSQTFIINDQVENQITRDVFNAHFTGDDFQNLYPLLIEVIKLNFITPSLMSKITKFTNKAKEATTEGLKTLKRE